MDRGWVTTSIGVPALWSLGGALMFGPTDASHWVACAIFIVAAAWIGVMGVVWITRTQERDWTVWVRVAGLLVIVFIITPALIYFAIPAGAQIPPGGVSGNCNNFGNNNFNCNTLYVDPPRAAFIQKIADDFLSRMPDKNKKIALITVGHKDDQDIGSQYQEYFLAKGYKVERTPTIQYVSPLSDKKLVFVELPDEYEVVISPSAH
jgi:hypothetical protein